MDKTILSVRDCPKGSCQRHGKCMYFNYPFCPVMLSNKRKIDIIDVDDRPICRDEQNSQFGLYEATPNCDGRIYPASGGGVKCTKCKGWFCF